MGKGSGKTMDRAALQPLSLFARFSIYAVYGILCEVLFTAACNSCQRWDRKLAGYTSLWALPIYGSGILLIEGLYLQLRRHCPLLVRLTVYTLCTYLWEFSMGFLLRQFGACPWDYSGFRYNFKGLVTLEYVLPWAVACLIAEQHVIKNTLRMHLGATTQD